MVRGYDVNPVQVGEGALDTSSDGLDFKSTYSYRDMA